MLKKLIAGVVLVSSIVYASSEVNVYSHRHYDSDKQLFKMFEDKTGIKVNIVKAKANELMMRLEKEGKNSPADIFITADVGRLYLAQSKGLFQKIDSQYLNETIPEQLREKDGYWFGLTKRARVIVYNKDKVKPSELSTYEDLTAPKWNKRVIIRKSSNIYNQSLLASMIDSQGREKAKIWAEGIVKNMGRAPTGSDRDQMKAVVAGVGDVAIVNTYYVGQLLNSKKSNEVMVGKKMGVFFPNQGEGERGTHINISGAGVTLSSKNRDNAIKLLEFLASPEAQKVFAEANYEYPANPNVKASKLIQSLGTFKEDSIELYKYGVYNAEAVKIFDEVNWK
ncbi:MAG: Fe(3+) ABC transporter substrate-binding protein [Sulfurospirillum sp.]|nr:Fe(3+) ABC transporter substrate-binding protein [Sulfurospirillum sp.]